jgi:putative flippase GtrA
MYKDLKLNKSNSLLYLFEKYKSFIRFGVVGCINTGVDFLTFTILYSLLGFDKLLCQTGGYSVGVINSFILNKLWTFKEQKSKSNTAVQFINFACVNVISLGISLLGIYLLSSKGKINVYVSKVIVTVFLQVFNYLVYKCFIFRKKNNI